VSGRRGAAGKRRDHRVAQKRTTERAEHTESREGILLFTSVNSACSVVSVVRGRLITRQQAAARLTRAKLKRPFGLFTVRRERIMMPQRPTY
jgi:hypothetical protein